MQLLSGNQHLTLGARLGRGGEGEVLEVTGRPGLAAKVYHQPDRTREAKINALIAGDLARRCRAAAFPLEIVRDDRGRFAGFIMPKIAACQPIHELFGIASMKRYFPRANWAFLVRVALNFARSVASVHAAGVVIGDVNSSGIMVGQSATITLIDADSFQFGQFGCRVGMAEYTPPELQNRHLSAVARTANHDAFGVAVIIFQLLALGRHPYAGVRRAAAIPPAEAIAQHRFAYSLLRETGLKPPASALQLDELPLGIRTLFERAFSPNTGPRPSALEWTEELAMVENNLRRCTVRPDHIIPAPSGPCPWCRLERSRTSQLFPASKLPPVACEPALLPVLAKTREAISHAKAVAGETIRPKVLRTQPPPSEAANAALRIEGKILHRHWSAKQIANFCSGSQRDIAANLVRAEAALTQAIDAWQTRVGIWNTHTLCSELSVLVRKLEHTATMRALIESSDIEAELRRQAIAVVARQSLKQAAIPGISQGLTWKLAQVGIETAADLIWFDFEKVRGLGASRTFALRLWRDTLLAKAQRAMRSDPAALNAATADAQRQYRHRQRTLQATIADALQSLDDHVASVRAAIARPDRAIMDAYDAIDQALSDLKHLGYNAGLRAGI